MCPNNRAPTLKQNKINHLTLQHCPNRTYASTLMYTPFLLMCFTAYFVASIFPTARFASIFSYICVLAFAIAALMLNNNSIASSPPPAWALFIPPVGFAKAVADVMKTGVLYVGWSDSGALVYSDSVRYMFCFTAGGTGLMILGMTIWWLSTTNVSSLISICTGSTYG